jgi:hypothetical protein
MYPREGKTKRHRFRRLGSEICSGVSSTDDETRKTLVLNECCVRANEYFGSRCFSKKYLLKGSSYETTQSDNSGPDE